MIDVVLRSAGFHQVTDHGTMGVVIARNSARTASSEDSSWLSWRLQLRTVRLPPSIQIPAPLESGTAAFFDAMFSIMVPSALLIDPGALAL